MITKCRYDHFYCPEIVQERSLYCPRLKNDRTYVCTISGVNITETTLTVHDHYARTLVSVAGVSIRIGREECNVGRSAFSPATEAQKAGDSCHMVGAWRVCKWPKQGSF